MTASRSQVNSEFQHIAITATDGSLLGIDVEQLQVADLSGLTIPGGSNGQAIVTDGNGNLSWANATGGGGSVISEFGSNVLPNGTSITVPSNGNVDVLTFTLPSAGTWEVQYSARGQVAASTRWVSPFLTDNSNNEIANSRAICAYITNPTGVVDLQGTATMATNITTTGSAAFKLRAYSNAGGSVFSDPAAGCTKVSWKKISGFIPSTGTLQTYARFTRTTQQTGTLTAGTRVICNVLESSSGSDITVDTITGQVTLASGKTFRLRGMVPNYISTGAGARPEFCWFNETTSAYIGSSASIYGAGDNATFGAAGGTAEAIITTSATTVVSFRILQNGGGLLSGLGGNGDFPATGSYPWIDIETMGTSSVAQFVGTLSSVYSPSLSYPTGTIVVKDNMLYQSNGDVAAGTVFTLGTTGATWTQVGFGTITAENGSVAPLNGQTIANPGSGDTPWTDITNGSFTLQSPGTWQIDYLLSSVNSTTNWVQVRLVDSGGTEITGSKTTSQGPFANSPVTSIATVTVTITTPTAYKLQARTFSSTLTVNNSGTVSQAGQSYVRWNKISGFVPANGTSVQYGSYRVTSRSTAGDFDLTALQGNMPVTSSIFVTLRANTTYELRASLEIRSTYAVVEWQTAAGTVLGNQGGSYSVNSADTGVPTPAYAVFTPTVDTQVKLRMTIVAGFIQTNITYGEVSIRQIGTTSTAAFTGSISNSWNINNTYAGGTIVVKDGMLYQSNGTVNTGTPFSVGTTDGTWSQIGFGSVSAEFGEAVMSTGLLDITAGSGSPVTALSFTLPSAGTWELDYVARAYTNVSAGVVVAIYNGAGTLVANSEVQVNYTGTGIAGGLQNTGTGVLRVTTTGSEVYTMRAWRDGASGTVRLLNDVNGKTSVKWKKISGFVPSNGTSVSYSSVSGIASVPASVISPSVTPVAIVLSGGTRAVGTIPYNTVTGVWTLTAGIAYQFELEYVSDGATVGVGDVNLAFTDATTSGTGTVRIGPNTDAAAISVTFTGRIISRPASYTFVYTPTTNQTVRLSSMFCDGACNVSAYAVIKQIGSTAATGFIGSVTNSWNINNTYPSGTIVVRDGMLYQANSTITAGTPFVVGTTSGTWLLLNSQAAEYGSTELASTFGISPATNTDILSFTLPTAGVWEVTYQASVEGAAGTIGNIITAWLTDNSNNVIDNSSQRVSWAGNSSLNTPCTYTVRITTTGAQTFKLRGRSTAASVWYAGAAQGTDQNTNVMWRKISGFLPLSATNEVSGYANADVTFDTGFGWGLYFSGTDAQFFFRNTSSSAVNIVIMDEYYIDTGSAKSIGQRGKTSIAAGGTSFLWTDNTLVMNGMGDIETGYIIISTGGPGAYALGAFVSKYEYYCSVGAGYNNNYFRVKKVW